MADSEDTRNQHDEPAPPFSNLDLDWPEHASEPQAELFGPPEPEPHHPMSVVHGYRVFRDLEQTAPNPKSPGRGRFAHRGWNVDLELKVREERAYAWQFRQLAGQLMIAMQRRVYESVLTRASRRFLVEHADVLIEVARRLPRRGREITEEDWIDVMNRAFGTGAKRAPAQASKRAAGAK